jgi:broad specificity phosphatase PhoE
MTSLLLVRHGQAPYGSANYDLLSPLGERQSHRLGAWLTRQGLKFGGCWSGPLRHVAQCLPDDSCAVVVSSAGPIAMAMRLALDLDCSTTIRVVANVCNGSITELRYQRGEWVLQSFNSIAHLDRGEITLL